MYNCLWRIIKLLLSSNKVYDSFFTKLATFKRSKFSENQCYNLKKMLRTVKSNSWRCLMAFSRREAMRVICTTQLHTKSMQRCNANDVKAYQRWDSGEGGEIRRAVTSSGWGFVDQGYYSFAFFISFYFYFVLTFCFQIQFSFN